MITVVNVYTCKHANYFWGVIPKIRLVRLKEFCRKTGYLVIPIDAFSDFSEMEA